MAGALVCHPDGATAEKAKTLGLNTLFKLKGESGGKRHRGEITIVAEEPLPL
jgi:hypothetical protein